VILTGREDDRFADFAADRITQRMLKKRLAKKLIGGI